MSESLGLMILSLLFYVAAVQDATKKVEEPGRWSVFMMATSVLLIGLSIWKALSP